MTLGIIILGILLAPQALRAVERSWLGRTAVDVNTENLAWNLTLVNADHPLPSDFTCTVTEVENGVSVDERIADDLRAMLAACRAEGLEPYLRSGFRTRDDQQRILDDKIAAYEAEGLNWFDARREARSWVAEPGTSEHELGLAVDINDASGGEDVYAWLAEYAHEYGFIQRYPAGKADVTGISNEPWHYRYVGQDAARAIAESGLTLEEYLAS